jgi:hypothetical protein
MKDFTTGVRFILGLSRVELSEQGSPYQIFLARAAASFFVTSISPARFADSFIFGSLYVQRSSLCYLRHWILE